MMTLCRLAVTGMIWAQATIAFGLNLVTEDTIKRQKNLVQEFLLSNAIPVVYYEIANSDILQINTSFAFGLRDVERKVKPALSLAFSAMPLGAVGFPKAKIFELTAKFSSGVVCTSGIELSSCSLTTVNDYWKDLMPLFAAVVSTPTYKDEDIAVEKERQIAEMKEERQEPGSYVNEAVNRVFYEPDHPYRLGVEESINAMPGVSVKDLKGIHATALNAARMRIVVVGSLPLAELKAELEKSFGSIPRSKFKDTVVLAPRFDAKKAFSIENRDIPTAYLRMKFNGPGILAKDSVAARLMFSILDEELGDEVRTKRSLSYAVNAILLDYNIGIGVINASTSKPKETLEAINEVIARLKSKTLTPDELDEYKTVYATHYFLTLEEHAALGAALANSLHYFHSLDQFFGLPKQLDAVTAKDVQELANRYLVNFRLGVVYSSAKFNEEWAKTLVSAPKAAGASLRHP